MEYLTFKASIQAEILSPTSVVLLGENKSRCLLKGRDYVLLCPYLKKKYSIDQIIQRLEKKLSATEIYYALFRLQQKGFLDEHCSILPKQVYALCDLLNVPVVEAESRIRNTTICIQTFGKVSAKPFIAALKSLSLKVGDEGNLQVVITDNYRHPEIREKYLKSKTPFFLIKPTSSEIWIGPLIISGETACFDCLLSALKRNAKEELIIERERGIKSPITIQKATNSTTSAIAYNLAAHEIFKWIVQTSNSNIESKIVTYHFPLLAIASHHVIKTMDCPTCASNADKDQPEPILLTNQKKYFTEDGGHRIRTPEETYKAYEHLISPISGIIEFLKPNFEDPTGLIHVYAAEHTQQGPHFQSSRSLNGSRSGSAGKGKTQAQSKTSCLCEAIERYSGIFQGNERREKHSYNEIKNNAIHPNSILLFSDHQYQIKEEWNKTCIAHHKIPDPFDPTKIVDWSPVYSMTEKRFKYIPTGMCYYSYPTTEHFFSGDSNGCAAGNTKEEAILQGFFELIERDSCAIWWYSRFKCPKVDLKSFGDAYIGQLIDSYSAMGRSLWVLDIRMDFDIPTFIAVSIDSQSRGKILFGLGCHFDPKIALHRALSEMNQCLPFLKHLDKSPENEKQEIFNTMQKWLINEHIDSHPYFLPNGQEKKYKDYLRFDTDDLKEDILICQNMVEKKGMEMLILDQTRPDIKLPVVKVFVPGLRHFWNRYAKGRLYDVPAKLGFLQKPLQEEELNPIPFFF